MTVTKRATQGNPERDLFAAFMSVVFGVIFFLVGIVLLIAALEAAGLLPHSPFYLLPDFEPSIKLVLGEFVTGEIFAGVGIFLLIMSRVFSRR